MCFQNTFAATPRNKVTPHDMSGRCHSPPKVSKACVHAAYRGGPRATFCRDWATKSWKGSDQRSRSASCGGGSRVIMKMTRMGLTFHLGGCDSAISIAVMPSAHTSTCSHYESDIFLPQQEMSEPWLLTLASVPMSTSQEGTACTF